MDNPNEYDDDSYTRYSVELSSAIQSLWEAGASLENLESEIENGLENASVEVDVRISTKG